MYKYIRIHNTVSKPLDFLTVGRINILCGKNNSGKSTILEAINNNNFSIGIDTSNLDQSKVYDKLLWRFGDHLGVSEDGNPFIVLDFKDSKLASVLEDIFERNYIKRFIKENDLIWSTDLMKLSVFINREGEKENWRYTEKMDEVDWYLDRQGSYVQQSADMIIQSLSRYHKNDKLFIKPKREIRAKYRTQELSKKSLLKHLFYLNQSTDEEEIEQYRLIENKFREITEGAIFKVKADKELNLTLFFGYSGSNLIQADRCGLGLRDVLYIVSVVILSSNKNLILLEEPENHLHPGLQRKLLDFIFEIDKKQFFIATHSNVFLDMKYAEKIFKISYKEKIEIQEVNSQAILLETLGYEVTDNLVSDLIILVEGPSDKFVIGEFLRKRGLLAKFNIKIWSLGGAIMNSQDLSVVSQISKVIALLDNDPDEDRSRFLNKCNKQNIEVFTLSRYSIENYYTIEAIKIVFGSKVTAPDDYIIDPNLSIKKQEIGSVNLKRKDNPLKIARAMNWEDIENNDLGEFILRIETIVQEP